eukprot:11964_1
MTKAFRASVRQALAPAAAAAPCTRQSCCPPWAHRPCVERRARARFLGRCAPLLDSLSRSCHFVPKGVELCSCQLSLPLCVHHTILPPS